MAQGKPSPKRKRNSGSKKPPGNRPESVRLGASVRQQFETLKQKADEEGIDLAQSKIEVVLPE